MWTLREVKDLGSITEVAEETVETVVYDNPDRVLFCLRHSQQSETSGPKLRTESMNGRKR